MRLRLGILFSLVSICILSILSIPNECRAGLPISPYLFGENLWNGDVSGAGANLAWGPMKAAGFRVIRVGGITYNDKTPSVAKFTLWIDSIRSIGAEPLIQVSTVDSASVAVELVNSLNIKLKFKVKFWSIGNEPTCGLTADAATIGSLAAKIKERASAMKKVDPSILIFAGDECYWRGELYDALIGGAQDITGKDADGHWFIDRVSFHNYPFPGADKNTVYTRQQVLENGIPGIRGMINQCNAAAALANAKHNRMGTEALACALTEVNVTYWNSSDNTPTGVGARSFLNGQFLAEVFGSGMEFGVSTVAPWSMQESGGDGSGSDLGLFDGNGPLVPRPSYYHIKMIAPNMHGEFLPTTMDKTGLKTYATVDQDTAAILVLNENLDQGYRFTVNLKGAASSALNTITINLDPGWVGQLTDSIPPQSTLLLRLPKSGPTAMRYFYSVGMAQKFQPPLLSTVQIAAGNRDMGKLAAQNLTLSFRPGELSGDLQADGPFEVALLELDGKIRVQDIGRGKSWVLPVGGCRPGTYVLRIMSGARSQEWKIVLLDPG